MSLLSILSTVAGPVFTVVKGLFGSNDLGTTIAKAVDTWAEGRERRKNLQLEADLAVERAKTKAKIERIQQETKMYADADLEAIKQWQYSIKDDILTYSVLALVLACFIPEAQVYVYRGIQLLNQLPIWIQVIIVGMYVSVLGLRFLFRAPLPNIFSARRVKEPKKTKEKNEADKI